MSPQEIGEAAQAAFDALIKEDRSAGHRALAVHLMNALADLAQCSYDAIHWYEQWEGKK